MGTMASATPRDLVERFYHEVWNRADERAARDILDPDFRFRASLGPELRGPDGFIVYLRAAHAALGNFTCIIEDMIATPDRAAAKMEFRGTHRGTFFGVEATGRDRALERGCVLHHARRSHRGALGARRRRWPQAAAHAGRAGSIVLGLNMAV